MSEKKVSREGLLGKKMGMTQIFAQDGEVIPVTVVQTGPCYIVDLKTEARDGYKAVQIGFGEKKAQRINRPLTGHLKKAEKGGFYHVREIRCDTESLGWNTVGQELKIGEIFENGQLVDITGVSIGKGFAGVIKRHGMKGQPATRGTHEDRRNIGAIGCRKFPGRVFKNKRMAGHMGMDTVTVQNLEVVGVNADENILLIRGGIPGSKGSLVVIRKATKAAISDKKAA